MAFSALYSNIVKFLEDNYSIYGIFIFYDILVAVAASWPYFQVSFLALLLCLFSILKFMPQPIQVCSLDPVRMVCYVCVIAK